MKTALIFFALFTICGSMFPAKKPCSKTIKIKEYLGKKLVKTHTFESGHFWLKNLSMEVTGADSMWVEVVK
jgi:hypothetical protein